MVSQSNLNSRLITNASKESLDGESVVPESRCQECHAPV